MVARPTGSLFGIGWNQSSQTISVKSLFLDVLQRKLGFRIARGLLERPAYREFFAAGLTVFDFAEGFESSAESGRTNSLARVEVENLIREIGLIGDHAELQDESLDEIEPARE